MVKDESNSNHSDEVDDDPDVDMDYHIKMQWEEVTVPAGMSRCHQLTSGEGPSAPH